MNCLVETGTYLGEMIFAQIDNFSKIYSIEIDKELFQRATRIFSSKSQVEVFLGDSGEVLPVILNKLNQPALFWLDGRPSNHPHYQKYLPVSHQEIKCPHQLRFLIRDSSNSW